jgi:hypothetical protein
LHGYHYVWVWLKKKLKYKDEDQSFQKKLLITKKETGIEVIIKEGESVKGFIK